MRKAFYIIITIFIFSITSTSAAQKFKIDNGDTINVVDNNNLKQGFWKIFGSMKKNLPAYQPDQVVEQGKYKNSRKQGLWKKFFPNGKTKSEIEYVNSRPKGFYKTYYDNGQVEEEGNWSSNRQTGDFKRYHTNGEVSQKFIFNESGKRDGTQEYFYEDGTLMIVADIKGGKEQKVTEYHPDGSLKAEKAFIDGKLDAANTKVYEPKTPIVEKKEDEGKVEIVKVKADEKINTTKGVIFTGEGTHKIYNANKQLSKTGFFKRYRLMDGKHYIYDEDGILYNIKLFKKGRYIGDAPLPKD
jgi:antitoxin component YwqK of YwqJK toxin-antitoxin module